MDICHLDIDAIANRYELTFRRQNHDRPVMWLTFPQGQAGPELPAPAGMMERWFNFEWRIECFERSLQGTGFLAEGFPSFWCNLGPDVMAGFMGSELEFAPDTSWAKYRITNWDQEPPLRFHRQASLWQAMEKFLVLSAQRGQERWLIGSGDLHTNADGLSALRGPENLLLDLYDQPQQIKTRMQECHEVFAQVLQAHFDIIHPSGRGMNSSWLVAACRGRYAAIQNDFCCMVGPEMFAEFFQAYVEKEAALLDHSIYHLDGPNAIQHVEAICASPSLDAIQWVPGAGSKPLVQWPELLQKIQALGKGLWLYPSASEAPAMMEYLQPEGCFYTIGCSSLQEAQDLMKECDRIHSAKRRGR